MRHEFRVLLTDPIESDLEIERAELEPLGVRFRVAADTNEARLAEEAADADAVIVTYARITAPVIAAARRCRVIARSGIGYDNIEVDAAAAAGIPVTFVPDYCLEEVADHTLTLLLALARDLPGAARIVREGGWTRPGSSIHRLQDRRLTVIGFGGIGRRVARRALAFGLRVTVFDPYVPVVDMPGVDRAETLATALADADFVSLHTPLNATNRHLINRETIAMMGRAPVVINTARGGLVDLDALAQAIADRSLAGAALDVTEVEPLPCDHPLRADPRVVITPHMGFYSIEALAELRTRVAREVARALRGEALRNQVPVSAAAR